jgi:hypothetical protein
MFYRRNLARNPEEDKSDEGHENKGRGNMILI